MYTLGEQLFKNNNKDSRTGLSDVVLVSLLLTLNMHFSTESQPAFTCSKLATEALEQGVKYVQRHMRRQWRSSGAFIVNFEHVSHLVLVFPLLTLNM